MWLAPTLKPASAPKILDSQSTQGCFQIKSPFKLTISPKFIKSSKMKKQRNYSKLKEKSPERTKKERDLTRPWILKGSNKSAKGIKRLLIKMQLTVV